LIRAIIADDEEPARARLARLVAAHSDIEIAGAARDGLEAVEKIEAIRPDLLSLDIEMPGLSGFEVLQSLPPGVPLPLVIFVTGYDQHALAAFDANALAYLLKPVEPERLAQALVRARKLHAAADHGEREREHVRRVARESPKALRQIVCRKRDRLLLVAPEQILWLQVEDGIVKAHTAADTFWVNYPLGDLETGLSAEMFFRARREVLVNMARIKEIRPYFKSGFLLIMSDATAAEIVVSERQMPPIPGL
jgi:DNA-binding LytR/AlgR family response regulator